MGKPWTDGPRELIQHAIDHLALGGDFDRRIAMISIDNAVELMVKVFLGLPKRARNGSSGPSRKELDAASESFPDLLSLLETHASGLLQGINLDEIEWYHRLRNQLYHSGNGITVERGKVETYLSLAQSLFECLFQEDLVLAEAAAHQTAVGEFLSAWIQLERLWRESERRRQGGIKEAPQMVPGRGGSEELAAIGPEFAELYEVSRRFRNELVHGLAPPDPEQLKRHTDIVHKLVTTFPKKLIGRPTPPRS